MFRRRRRRSSFARRSSPQTHYFTIGGAAIVAIGPPDAALTPAALRDLYGVDVAVAWLEGAGRNVCAPSLQAGRTR